MKCGDVRFVLLDGRAQAPARAYDGDAGFDLTVLEDTVIGRGRSVDVRTGVAIELPDGYYARLIGRSSALRKRGVLVVEGIIDGGFRGELFSYCHNPGRRKVTLRSGVSVAQIILCPVVDPHWVESAALTDSARGTNGFGSSGR